MKSRSMLTRQAVEMWVGLWLIGLLSGIAAVWVGQVGIPILAFAVTLMVLADGTRYGTGFGLVGVGMGMGALALFASASCQPMTRFDGGMETCEGPDLGIYVVIAVGFIAAGSALILRRLRGDRHPSQSKRHG